MMRSRRHIAPGWDNVYVWIWDTTDTSRNYTGGAWPGVRLQPDANGMYSYTFTPDNANAPVMFVTGALYYIVLRDGDVSSWAG